MTRDEIIEARDTLENVAGHFYNKDDSKCQTVEDIVDMLTNLLGCDDCSDLGWIFQLPSSEPMIIRCESCNKFDSTLKARDAAFKAFKPAYDKLCNELSEK